MPPSFLPHEIVAVEQHGSLPPSSRDSLPQRESAISGASGPGSSSVAPQIEIQGHVPEQRPPETHPSQQGRTTVLIRVLGFLGQGPAGTVYRKSLVRVIWNLSWGFLQVWLVLYISDDT